jgi:membrane-bound lytic murein transglycosylase A
LTEDRGAAVPLASNSAQVPPGANADPPLRAVAFDELPGWRADDALAAFRAFKASAAHMLEGRKELRNARAPSEALLGASRRAVEQECQDNAAARAFFEAQFTPWEIGPDQTAAFFTGYFEPEFEGSLERTPRFQAPILRRPPNLVTLAMGEALPDCDFTLTSAIRDGHRVLPCPDRADIETGAFDGRGFELVWLQDRVAVYIVQVQGCARVMLANGKIIRLRYGGRNGWPYTSIGRLLIGRGAIAADAMSLETLMGWLRAHPGQAESLMRENRSYVFFERADWLREHEGPIGGAGVSLTAGRSIAVDRGVWSYGLPFFIDVDRREIGAGSARWRRLMIAQDTGAAIVGQARVDIFFGSGAVAGTLAGRQRHHGRLFVFLPRARAK